MSADTDDLAPSQDYPIRHFALMRETAEALKRSPAQVLDHWYSYQTFGSWTLVVRYKGVPYKLIFDGKEGNFGLHRSATKKHPYDWSEVWPPRAVDGEVSSTLIAEWITAAHHE